MQAKYLLAISIGLAAVLPAKAQRAPGDTVLKGSTIEVIQAYKPQVKNAPKPEWMPLLPKADTSHPVFNFEVPQQTLYYSYSSEPIKAMTLGMTDKVTPFPSYVKVGAGNLSTLYVDAGIGSISGENYQTAIQLHHLSQKGIIKNQQTSLSGLTANGGLQTENNDWQAGIHFGHNQYNLFGYDHNVYDFKGDSLKQRYTTIGGHIGLVNTTPWHGITYRPMVSVSLYSASNSTNETSITLNAPFTKALDSVLDLQIALFAEVSALTRPDNNVSNNLFGISPGLVLHDSSLSGHGFVAFAAGNDGDFYILPDLLGEYRLRKTPLFLGGGWHASVRRNTYEDLSTDNPFLFNQYEVSQSRRDEIFGQVRGAAGKHITYTARLSWWNINNMATYLNIGADYRKFGVYYADLNAISVKTSLRYTLSSKWSVGAAGAYYQYYNFSDVVKEAWHQPNLKITGDAMFRPFPKLTLNGNIDVLGGIRAINNVGKTITLKPVADLSLGAEYAITKRLGAFLQINNLLNNKYERWQGYQAYGLNIYGGLRLKF